MPRKALQETNSNIRTSARLQNATKKASVNSRVKQSSKTTTIPSQTLTAEAPKNAGKVEKIKDPSILPPLPDFTPMVHRVKAHTAYNMLHDSLILNAYQIFTLFFTDDMFNIMIANTNAYALEHLDEHTNGRPWSPTSPAELRIWVGITIYMGLNPMPGLRDYWRHDDEHPLHPITKFMTSLRFEQIKRFFHISTTDKPAPGSDNDVWYYKLEPLLSQLRRSSKRYRMPSTNVSVDEAMIMCTGRSKHTYKMPNKPIDEGYKIHCLADHGYVWDFHMTSNAEGPDPVAHTLTSLPALGITLNRWHIVYHLICQLPTNSVRSTSIWTIGTRLCLY